MTHIDLLDKTKKKKILSLLDKEYGISQLPHLFIKSGKDKIRIFSGSLSKDELNNLAKTIHVDSIGIKLLTLETFDGEKDGIRLSFDILNMPEIKSQITKNFIEITDEQLNSWLKGDNLDLDIKQNNKDLNSRFIIIKHNNDFFGIARNQGFLKNYVPKERRLR
ncbi:hypothetical protein HYW74_02630 [Candidatus Pacearchaeota archaeon]|nr:hypothetical protein [Candidatus Pacearchaeota archaeon]